MGWGDGASGCRDRHRLTVSNPTPGQLGGQVSRWRSPAAVAQCDTQASAIHRPTAAAKRSRSVRCSASRAPSAAPHQRGPAAACWLRSPPTSASHPRIASRIINEPAPTMTPTTPGPVQSSADLEVGRERHHARATNSNHAAPRRRHPGLVALVTHCEHLGHSSRLLRRCPPGGAQWRNPAAPPVAEHGGSTGTVCARRLYPLLAAVVGA